MESATQSTGSGNLAFDWVGRAEQVETGGSASAPKPGERASSAASGAGK
jgi:hypothetical protein